MSNPLVVHIEDGSNNDLAVLYMHWGGYTDSSLQVASDILDELCWQIHISPMTESTKKSIAVNSLLAIDEAGLVQDSYRDFYGVDIPQSYQLNLHRNAGLIGCIDEDIRDLAMNHDGVDIYIDIEDLQDIKIRLDNCIIVENTEIENEKLPEVTFSPSITQKMMNFEEFNGYISIINEFEEFKTVLLSNGNDFRVKGTNFHIVRFPNSNQ